MPQDAHDATVARQFVALGPEVIAPVADEMLRQLKDETSPVALIYAEFFAANGERFKEDVALFLQKSRMEYQHYMIVGWILPHWSKASLTMCLHPLLQLVTSNSGASDTDIRAIQLLAKHRLADDQWLRGWIEFKKHNFQRLSWLLDEVENEL